MKEKKCRKQERCQILIIAQKQKHLVNQDKSAARFCHQVAALVPDMFLNFYWVKNHKIANNSATTEPREKVSTDLEYLEFKNFLCMFD